jgi:hypothetical protein
MSIPCPRALRTPSLLPALLLPVLLASCSNTTALTILRYGLVGIDGALPGAIPGREDVEVTSGVLAIRSDDRVELTLDLRCAGGSSCSLPSEWERLDGRIDRAAGPVAAVGLVRWSDGREATADEVGGGVELTFLLPGGEGSSVFRFQ